MQDQFDIVDFQVNIFGSQSPLSNLPQPKTEQFSESTICTGQNLLADIEDSNRNMIQEQGQSGDQSDKQGQNSSSNNELKKKQKGKRNTQNTVRTIIRRLRKYQIYFYINIDKFFQLEKPLNILALCYRLNQADKLEEVKQLLRGQFQKILQAEYLSQNKDLKIKYFLQFLFELRDQDFEQLNLKTTIDRLKEAGQLKKHPKNMNLQQFKQILGKILPK